LVASHGNVLRLLLAHALGLPEPDHRIPKNCSVLVLDLPLSSPGRLEVIKEPEWDGPL
jgi:broad specificity phosphatase PhoE